MSSPSSMTPAEKPRLLVVDDEAAVLSLVRAILEKAEYEVTTCESAGDALRLLGQGPFDCVITDAIMPGVTGYDLARSVRESLGFQEMPVLMLTRKRHRQDVKKAVEAGVTDYIFKPIDAQLLLEKVETSLKRGGGGKRPNRPVAGQPRVADAEIGVGCKIVAIEGSLLTVRLAFAPEPRMSLRLRGRIFDESGMTAPEARVDSCEPRTDETGPLAPFPWEARMSLPGASDDELARLRSWLER